MSEGRGDPLRVGIVGCGWVSDVCHLPALRDVEEATVVGVADVEGGRAEQAAARFSVPRWHTDYRALLDDPRVEAIAVCVPASAHFEVASAALDAGKHVFLEKPLTADLNQCDRLLEIERRVSRPILVGFNMRCHEQVQQMRRMIAEGAVDTVQSMWTVFTSDTLHKVGVSPWRKERRLGGGALIEQAIHHFDLWRYLLRSEVEQVFAVSAARDWDDETAAVTARMSNGVVVSSLFSEASSNNNEIEVCGRSGRLHLSTYCFDGLARYSITDSPGALRTRLQGVAQTLRQLPKGIRKMRHGGEFMSAYRTVWRHFADCVRNGTTPACTLEDARRTLQVLLAIVQSASLGQPVTVADASRTMMQVPPQEMTRHQGNS